jgi:L-histidine Nalpha-methyltransferase
VSKSAPALKLTEPREPVSNIVVEEPCRWPSEQVGRIHEAVGSTASATGADRLLWIERRLPDPWLARSLGADVRDGLTKSPKRLQPKWLYDRTGSELFERIMELDAYYLPRAERSVLATRADEIAGATGACTLVDLGCGSASKTRLLLDALWSARCLRRYVAVDVSESALARACSRVRRAYPGVRVQAVLSDYEQHLGLPDDREPMLVASLGSSIGNLMPEQRSGFLASVRSVLEPGDAFLLGTDLVKDPEVLRAAYDDPEGVTAQFNLNLLRRLNAELGADFDPGLFAHVVVWDEINEWIEMRLRALADQVVTILALKLTVAFTEGEEMRTEISAKFRRDRLEDELAAAGLAMRSWWTDERSQFGVSLSVTR